MLIIAESLFVILLLIIFFSVFRSERKLLKGHNHSGKVEEIWKGKERRHHVRFKKMLDVHYKLEKRQHLKDNCRSLNLSEGGIKLLLDEKMALGTILDLKVALPSENRSVEIEGKVVWCEDAPDDEYKRRLFHIGVEFSGMNKPDGRALAKYIRSLEGTSETD